MRAPSFWWRERPGFAARMLKPVGATYGAVTAARMGRPGRRASVPVLCVGNLVVGGAGKTPMAMAVARFAEASGHHPAVLSRGHGRARAGAAVIRVDPDRHGPRDCGDEPLLLARVAPTYVSTDRAAAAAVAAKDGATLLILDDGLQSPALVKDLSIAVADGATGLGNGLCLPAGPLRAPAGRQWPFISLLCVVGPGAAGLRLAEQAAAAGVPVTTARVEPDPAALLRLRGRRLFAFAGIGRPGKFYETLVAGGLDVVGRRSFADHHRFTAGEVAALRRAAEGAGAVLVTTAKDRVRLPADFPVEVLTIDLVFDNPDELALQIGRTLGW